MHIEVIETGPLEREVQIAVEAEAVESESDRALMTLGRRVRVKGFRPGKVPKRELKRRYGKSVRRDAIQNLIRVKLAEALKRDDLESVIYVATPEVTDDEGAGGFSFRFNAEVRPAVDPKGYLGVKLEADPVDVAADDIDQQIEHLRERHAVISPLEERDTVAADDLVSVSYEPTSDAENLQIFKVEEQVVDLKQGLGYAEGLAEGLAGVKVGETKTIGIALTEGGPLAERVGATELEIAVTVHGLKHRVLPEVDDDFAEQAGPEDVETVDQLREKIRESLEGQKSQAREQSLRQQLQDKLLEGLEFDLPTAFLGTRVEDELHQQMRQFQQSGITPEQLGMDLADLRVKATERVDRQLRLEFVLQSIATREKVKVGDKDIDKVVEDLARASGQAASQVRKFYLDPSRRSGLEDRIRLDKTLDFLMSKATIEDESASAAPADSEAPSPDEADESGSDVSDEVSDEVSDDVTDEQAKEEAPPEE